MSFKTESQTALFYRLKGLKQSLFDTFVYAGSGIREMHDNIIIFFGRYDFHRARCSRHCIDSVTNEIDTDLLDLQFVN